MEAMLTSLVERYLAQHLHANAIFYAERLFAQWPSEVNRHLLASCYVYAGKKVQAVAVLRDSTAPSNRYLCARYCYELGRLEEAEAALLRGTGLEGRPVTQFTKAIMDDPSKIPNGAAGLHLLGCVSRRAAQREQAVACFRMALQLDRFLFVAFEALCEMGVEVDPEEAFSNGDEADSGRTTRGRAKSGGSSVIGTPDVAAVGGRTPFSPTFTPSPSATFRANHGGRGTPPRSTAATPATEDDGMGEDGGMTPTSTPRTATSAAQPGAPKPGMSTRSKRGRGVVAKPVAVRRSARLASTATPSESASKAPRAPRTPRAGSASTPTGARTRRGSGSQASGRTRATAGRKRSASAGSGGFSSSDGEEVGDDAARGGGGRGGGRGRSGSGSSATGASTTAASPRPDAVLGLLRVIGSAVLHLCRYRCKEALAALDSLPARQADTGWVHHRRGRAFFEMADYRRARRCFEAMRAAEPHRMEGLELFSTTLWHLKDAVALAHLAQVAMATDRGAPETWCVTGNSFSLQKEHETAQESLARAVQLDPNFTYAYTLCGHEHVANGELDKAITQYRKALRVDDRHYNAWYGLGSIFYRQEKAAMAEYHYRRAMAINPTSSPLFCYLGMVLHMTGRHEEALETLGHAMKMEPKNPQARFQRANVFFSLERYESALEEMLAVLERAPTEASVHLMIAKIYKRLGRIDEAVRHYDCARDLDPKDANTILRAMDKVHLADADEEVEL